MGSPARFGWGEPTGAGVAPRAASNAIFFYVLRTVRAWGDGRIGKLSIELRDPLLPSNLRWKATPRPTERRDAGRLLVWSLNNHRPARDLELTGLKRCRCRSCRSRSSAAPSGTR
jgi:hypothetical protein